MRSDFIYTVSEEIKEMSARSRELKAAIREKKDRAWYEQAELALLTPQIRVRYQALAFLRGRSLRDIEPVMRRKVHLSSVKALIKDFLPEGPVSPEDDVYALSLEWNAWVEEAIRHTEDYATYENDFLGHCTNCKDLSEDYAHQYARRSFLRAKQYMSIEIANTEEVETPTEVTPC